MKNLLARRYVLTAIGAIVGMIAGFFYWKYVGCASGSCPITASPINSTLWGSAMGGLLFNMFESNVKTK